METVYIQKAEHRIRETVSREKSSRVTLYKRLSTGSGKPFPERRAQ